QGAPVPKRMNQLGMGGAPVPGSLLTPDSPEETAALEQARAELAEAEAAARNGHQPPEIEARSEERETISQQ
ncbi:cytochrome b, partial [Pseudonocardia sp. DLS-67]